MPYCAMEKSTLPNKKSKKGANAVFAPFLLDRNASAPYNEQDLRKGDFLWKRKLFI